MVNAEVGVDVGGTFTDVVLIADGELTTTKVPSTADQSDGVIRGIRQASAEAGISPDQISEFSHAMTVSTNALLESDGARTALVTTDGFRDVLEIGRQTRPDLYDLKAEKPPTLVRRRDRFELDERTTTEGKQIEPDADAIAELIDRLQTRDIESVAISFLHAYVDETNESRVAQRLREELDVSVSASHEVLNEFREYERTSTAAVDAYVTPAIDSYISRLADRAADLGLPQPRIMQSNGGIADAGEIRSHAVQTVLSGPAAGVVGASQAAAEDSTSFEGFVTFDMGGTSSDVSLIRDGEVERTTDSEIGGYPIRVPMVDVTTVGAGGGSIAWVDAGGALRVGPQSAGSEPGPACYGRGGHEATVTDANLVLGYINRETQLGGELGLDYDAAVDALNRLADEADLGSALEAARGVFRVANANMTRAIRSVTVERGHDPREFGLVAFGGAGPMHAVALAERLNIGTVVVPHVGGVLSAYGLLAADETYDAVRTHQTALGETTSDELESIYEGLVSDLPVETAQEAVTVRRSADLRYTGQSFELEVEAEDCVDTEELRAAFERKHERVYGYTADEGIEVVNLRAAATVPRSIQSSSVAAETLEKLGEHTAIFDGTEYATPIYQRPMTPGRTVSGPAVLEQDESTTVIPPSWEGTVQDNGSLVLTEVEP
ncbi:hydantoinase/oxoprolinase family protein [Salinirubellus salinus]|uniref:Hydantoinase/oxoprolinase family protein n=1 Tax=Salinirubellus salinus TaxID=1364945 RepID=A0A9E7UDA2_9EURY|nr:hydantoinase/oxoprolinase family protein [Salinirubellus salinus]UWM56839.1 hydantoinase/oxoprolinase family protein [Salinirubellus salinus]